MLLPSARYPKVLISIWFGVQFGAPKTHCELSTGKCLMDGSSESTTLATTVAVDGSIPALSTKHQVPTGARESADPKATFMLCVRLRGVKCLGSLPHPLHGGDTRP